MSGARAEVAAEAVPEGSDLRVLAGHGVVRAGDADEGRIAGPVDGSFEGGAAADEGEVDEAAMLCPDDIVGGVSAADVEGDGKHA